MITIELLPIWTLLLALLGLMTTVCTVISGSASDPPEAVKVLAILGALGLGCISLALLISALVIGSGGQFA